MAVNMETAISYMESLKARGITYSMYGSRTGSDGTGDCSGTIYQALRNGGASNAGWVLNTDSMHNWLKSNGFKRIADQTEWNAKRGDITIFGKEGASGGAAGHVVMWVSNTHFIHCNYGKNGVTVDSEASMMSLYQMMWYTYRYEGAAPKPTPKPSGSGGLRTFVLGDNIWLREGSNTNSKKIALLKAGDVVKFDKEIHEGGYVWLRQPRGNGYGYIASGNSSGGKRTSTWGTIK